jgi:heme/copper-type cytochrome/quinol oxidase subunit 3
MAVTTTSHDLIPVDVTPATPARPRLLVLATSLASAAMTMGFVGLISVYISARAEVVASGERWLPDGVNIPLTQPNFMGLTLAFSVVTMWWAVSAIRNDDRPNTMLAFALSLMFAFAFLAQTGYLLTLMEMEILADERSALLYAVIGTHIAMTIVAIVFALVMALRTLGGDYGSRDFEGVLSAAIFWTMTVALYGVLWYAIYITK